MQIDVNKSIAKRVAGLVVFAVSAFVLFHSSQSPYSNNQFKKPRWASTQCLAEGQPLDKCAPLRLQTYKSSEVVYFDIDLEHGNIRRIK